MNIKYNNSNILSVKSTTIKTIGWNKILAVNTHFHSAKVSVFILNLY